MSQHVANGGRCVDHPTREQLVFVNVPSFTMQFIFMVSSLGWRWLDIILTLFSLVLKHSWVRWKYFPDCLNWNTLGVCVNSEIWPCEIQCMGLKNESLLCEEAKSWLLRCHRNHLILDWRWKEQSCYSDFIFNSGFATELCCNRWNLFFLIPVWC